MTDRTPARQVNTARDRGTVFAVQDGDLHIHQRIGTHFIDELSFGEVALSGDEQPSRLLNASNRVVSFTGREEEIAELTAWRDGGAAVAVRLVHGAAGQGKTRLAFRFAELSQRHGWVVCRARHSRDVTVRQVEIPAGNELVASRRLLVLVDYAERWPLSDLLALLHDQRLHGGPALRVLLLARPLDNWWYALTYRLSQSLGIDADSVELEPVGGTRAGSAEAFTVARSCFARALGVTEPVTVPPHVEGSVLTIHMAALAHVLAVRDGEAPPTGLRDLSAYLLSRERSHWQAMSDNKRIESVPQVLGRAVFVAALTRALDYPAAAEAVQSAAVADSPAAAGRVLDDHAMCYPPLDPDTRLEPLYPDLLAEDFVALQTPGHGIPRFRADPWTGTALLGLMNAGPRGVGTALPLLIEAAPRWPHLVDRLLVPLLRQRPQLAVDGGAPALLAVAAAREIPLDVLASIETLLPGDPPDDLCTGIAAVTERIVEDLARNVIDAVQAVRILQRLGSRLFDAGRVTEGLARLTEAVEATRRLVAGDRAVHAGRLEFALRTVGRAHIRVGNWPEAATSLSEAVGLWSKDGLGATLSAAEIATCLSELSLALWHTGEGPSSLSIRHRAIAHLRRLVAAHPEHRITLVRALVQQAEQLRQDSRTRASLDALDEAVKLLRALATNAEPGLELDFAAALLGRAKTLKSLDRLPEAEHAAENAVRILQRHAGLNISYDHDLALALTVESQILAALRRLPEAIEKQRTANAIHRRLVRINAARHELGLIRGLIDFARLCHELGQQADDTLRALGDAVRLTRASSLDAVTRNRLLRAANAVSADLLDASGRHTEADAVRQQAARQQSRTRRFLEPTELDRKRGRRLSSLPPRIAGIAAGHWSSPEIAAALATIDIERWDGLKEMFRDFDAGTVRECVLLIVRYQELASRPGTVRSLALLMDTYFTESEITGEVLPRATPDVAAALRSEENLFWI
ncbi:hypothetical protein [Actinoplanes sp. NPDC049802]|uniref:tetratricopeptide repeat protein n=1 Tax=Actinoplanes sp. NPDC049802 TaxID=3154742 RepID=UPI0033FF2F81